MTVLADAPGDPDALHDLGKAHTQDGDHAAAAKLIERAIEIDGADDPAKHASVVVGKIGSEEGVTSACCSCRRSFRCPIHESPV